MASPRVTQVLARLLSQVASKKQPDTSENAVKPHPTQETAEAVGSQPMGRSVCEPGLGSQRQQRLGGCLVIFFLPSASRSAAADLIPQKFPEPLEQDSAHGLLYKLLH